MRPPAVVELDGARHELTSFDAAVSTARRLLADQPAGSEATVSRPGLATRLYRVDEQGIVRRIGASPGGRLPGATQRVAVCLRLLPEEDARLRELAATEGSPSAVVGRLLRGG